MKKKEKKIVIIIICVIFVFIVGTILNFVFGAKRIYSEDLDDYYVITSKEHEGYILKSNLWLFPDELNEECVDKFILEYNDNLFTTIQIFLECTYSDEKFEAEIERLSYERKYYERANYDEKNFEYPAYVLSVGYNLISEYALIDYDNSKIIYIYIEDIDKKDIKFDEKYLPKGYSETGGTCKNAYEQG